MAQIEAAEDFVGQMQAMVADTWRERDTPEYTARATSISTARFLEALKGERWQDYVLNVMAALGRCGMRLESDGREEDGGCEGYFAFDSKGTVLDAMLHYSAKLFSEQVMTFAPEGWGANDTFECLRWENLVVVPVEDDSFEFIFDGTIGSSEKAN